MALGAWGLVAFVAACGSTSGRGVAASKEAAKDGGGAGGGADPSSDDAGGSPTMAAPGAPLSSPEQGIATYYNADGTGACLFDASPNDLMIAAMDVAEFDDSAVCGECVTIMGPNATITVRIVDECPDCEKGHLDLSQDAFAKIADVSLGRVSIAWQVVPCDVMGPLAYRFKEGSSQYWTAIQVRNSKLPVASLEWASGGGSFSMIPRQSYNYFVVSSGVGTTGPFQVRVTSSTGEKVVDTLPGVMAAQVVDGAAQFP